MKGQVISRIYRAPAGSAQTVLELSKGYSLDLPATDRFGSDFYEESGMDLPDHANSAKIL